MRKAEQIADSAGVFGAIFAALCCAGVPLIVSVLATLGLSFLRTDAILFPLMGLSLVVALWGFWQGRRRHASSGPLALACSGAVALVAGVVFVHGFPAKQLIGAGAVALIAATICNVRARSAATAREITAS
ncbi:MAG: MerC domain-containing protein [Gemmatimonadota bacterium]|nr:MerC domain-containing protein [Gemmatimonadota bacterium]